MTLSVYLQVQEKASSSEAKKRTSIVDNLVIQTSVPMHAFANSKPNGNISATKRVSERNAIILVRRRNNNLVY